MTHLIFVQSNLPISMGVIEHCLFLSPSKSRAHISFFNRKFSGLHMTGNCIVRPFQEMKHAVHTRWLSIKMYIKIGKHWLDCFVVVFGME